MHRAISCPGKVLDKSMGLDKAVAIKCVVAPAATSLLGSPATTATVAVTPSPVAKRRIVSGASSLVYGVERR